MNVPNLSQLAANFVSITGAEKSGAFPALTQILQGDNVSIPSLIQTLFDTALVVGAMLAVVRITYAGFQYMVSDIANTKSKAIQTMREALIGLVLLLAIVLILQQINPNLTNLNFTPSTNTTQ